MEATEVRCSEGVFKSINGFAKYLGEHSKTVHERLNDGVKNGLSESDVVEKLILCSKLKKEFNLGRLPYYEDLVVFHGRLYPSRNVVINLMGWSRKTTLNLMNTGMSLEEIEQYYNRCTTKNKKCDLMSLLRSKTDENSKVFEENGRLVLEVYGKRYKTVTAFLNDYHTAYPTFRREIEIPGTTICQVVDSINHKFYFLGREFTSVSEFSRFYKLSFWVSKGLLEDVNKSENLFKLLYSAIKESGVNFDGELEYLIRISKGLKYNKEDIIYQIQNYSNLKEGCTYYFDGKSYLTLSEFYEDMNLKIKIGNTAERLFNEEREKVTLFKIPGILKGVSEEEITSKSPRFYVYCYFYDILKDSTRNFDVCLNEIYNMLRKGISASEIKNLLSDYRLLVDSAFKNSQTGSKSAFISIYLSGSITKSSLLDYFNMNLPNMRIIGLKKFLQYSNLKIIKASYKFNSLQYYLCERNGGLCYLSGNDLLGIAVESVK